MGKGNRSRQDRALETVAVTQEATPKNTKLITTVATVAVAALLVACIALSVVVNTGIILRTKTAANTDNFSISGTEMAYLIYSQAQQMATLYQQYGLGDYTVDSLMASQGATFAENSLKQVKQNLTLCEYAKANGITLSDEDEEAIDTYMDSIAEAAATNFYSTDSYIKLLYGNGINASDIRSCLEIQYLASAAYEVIEETLKGEITDEKIDAYVKENVGSFYTVDYLSYGFIANLSAAGAEATEEEKAAYEADKTAMKALAETLAAAKTEEEFKSIVADYLVNTVASESFDTSFEKEKADLDEALVPTEEALAADKAALLTKLADYLKSLDTEETEEESEEKTEEEVKNDYQKLLDEIYADLEEDAEESYTGILTEEHPHYDPEAEKIEDYDKWLFDEATAVGSTKLVDNSADEDASKTKTTYTVYMLKTASHLDESKTQDVAHLLVAFESDKPTDEEKAAAKAEADELLAQFLAGETTLEAFEKFAEEHTDDSAVKYENVYEGQMVEEFEDWCFDEARTAGETAIVETEYGYHIMYYIGEGMPLWKANANDGVLSDLFEDWVETESAKVNYKANNAVVDSIIK